MDFFTIFAYTLYSYRLPQFSSLFSTLLPHPLYFDVTLFYYSPTFLTLPTFIYPRLSRDEVCETLPWSRA